MNIRSVFTLLLLYMASAGVSSQPVFSYKQAEWQQHVDYTIQVSLDDEKHYLHGLISMVYTNNSPDVLDELYIHLWPNAYKNNHTAFAVQKNQDNNSDFLLAPDADRGFIDSISFKIDGKAHSYTSYHGNIDIALIKLNTPVKPGEKATITTPFRVKIPGSFSRLGHSGQAYQITQWYPKPAVYDINGWNPIPYLDQGEFYSEFGSFDVQITLPQNYVVAATGVLQNESEMAFIANRINNPIDPSNTPASASELKSIRFKQDSIHDFAWFASKTFNIERSETTLANGHRVATFVYASEKKIDHCKSINKALQYYSNHAGYYPYSHCTAVLGSLKAGGGMEYPMITVCDFLNEDVIIHEVGHNWFYGLLGSNERLFPWMDESVNSFFEAETTKDEDAAAGNTVKSTTIASLASNDGIMTAIAENSIINGTNQAPGDESDVFTALNYGTMVYGQGAFVFNHLKGFLGEDVFYTCFRTYFDAWKYRHPLPDDMQAVFEQVSGKKLSWFFRDLLFTTKTTDYELEKVEKYGNIYKLTLENEGQIASPVPVDVVKGNEIIQTFWVDGFSGTRTLEFELAESFDRISLDARKLTTDINYSNNNYFSKGLFHFAEPLKVSLVSQIKSPVHKQLNLLPAYGYNIYDGSMVGLGLHNIGFPGRKTEYLLLPMYTFTTKTAGGYAQLYHTMAVRKNNISSIVYGIKSARFSFDNFGLTTYNKINPYITVNLNKPAKRMSQFSAFTLRYIYLNFQPQFDIKKLEQNPNYSFPYKKDQHFVRAEFTHTRKTAVRPFKTMLVAETGLYDINNKAGNYIKTWAASEHMLNYKKKNKGLTIRGFAGVFVKEAKNAAGLFDFAAGSYNGRFDYLFDQSMMGRNASFGLFQNQVLTTESAQKFTGSFGSASQWQLALNLKSTLPGKIPVQLYTDAVTFNGIENLGYTNAGGTFVTAKLFYQAGLAFVIIPQILEINIPLMQSEVITKMQEFQGIDKFQERISFSLHLNMLDPRVLLRNIKLF